ncbi:MAG: efflux RND transporter permease subunit [Calditrichia bacterium]
MKIAETSIRNPVGVILIVLSLMVLGFFSLSDIPVSFWPEFTAPTLIVMVPYPAAGPQEVEDQVAVPLEESLSTIEGVDELETTCSEGMCQVTVRFAWDVDFDEAKITVQEQSEKARSSFPPGVRPPVVLQVQDFIPAGIELGFASPQRDLNEIRNLVEEKVKNRLLRLENVATVQIGGGTEQRIMVWVNIDRIAAYGITLPQIQGALAAENLNLAAGKMESRLKNYFVRSIGKFNRLQDLENTVIASRNGNPIFLKDVARVNLENSKAETFTRLNGREVVSVSIREKSGGNTVAMAEEVKQEIADIGRLLPADLQIQIIRDQSEFIKKAVNNVLRNAAIGAVLASLIILLFLGNLRNTLIIILSIPISIIGTFVLIKAFGLSINTISLGGLALGVGMIVDSSIVVLENIFRHLRQPSTVSRIESVSAATREVGLAITASNLTSIVVFLPLAFLVGLFAVLLGELALTVVFALSFSILVALTVVPMLSFYLMRTHPGTGMMGKIGSGWQSVFDKILGGYRPLLRWSLRHPVLTLIFSFALLGICLFFLGPRLDVELLPAINESEFRAEVTMPEGTRLEVTDQLIKTLEADLANAEEVQQYFTTAGLFSARGEKKPNFAVINIQLKQAYRSQISAIMAKYRKLWQNLPGAKLAVRQTDITEGMRRAPVNVRILGDDTGVLQQLAQQALDRINSVPGVINLNSSVGESFSEFGLHYSRHKIWDLGLNSAQIANNIRLAVQGGSTSRFSSFGKEYDITVQAEEQNLQNITDLMNLPLVTPGGEVIPLRAVAQVSLQPTPAQIKRLDQQRFVEITGDISGGSRRAVTGAVQEKMGSLPLPSGYYLAFGGQSRAIADSFRSLLQALLLAIFLVYVVMGSQFNSFLHPFTIALSIPLAVIGVILGLYIFNSSLSMNALLGMIMLVGIVVNNGILLIDYIHQLRRKGMALREAVFTAGTIRLRPILITSLTTIFGMLPIALGFGEGGEALQPLGAVVVGGMATSTFLTLLVIPAAYLLMDRFSRRRFPAAEAQQTTSRK